MTRIVYEAQSRKNPLFESSFVRDTRGSSREEALFGLALVALIMSIIFSSLGVFKLISLGLSFAVGGPAALLFVVLGIGAWIEMMRKG